MSEHNDHRVIQLSANVWVHEGEINVGIIRSGDAALLIDFGAGGVLGALAALGLHRVDRVLLTHYHRDQAGALAYGAADQAEVVGPAAERHLLEAPEAHWTNPAFRWDVYADLSRRMVPAQPVKVARSCHPGERFVWGQATITVLGTPGHTDGSVSYQVDVDGRRVVFSGDVIAAPGQAWDLFSLQRGGAKLAGGGVLTDYHGYMGSLGDLLGSLTTLGSSGADALVPSHGVIMRDPVPAIDALAARLRDCYRQYASISALRYYFPEVFPAEYPAGMPPSQMYPPPDFLTQVGTSWLLASEEGGVFVMDCGSASVVDHLQALLSQRTITGVEGLWITHYHDDHVNACDRFLATFPCPVHADASVAGVIEQPLAHNLPCLSQVTVPVSHRTSHGETWQWREFTLTAYHLPGQSLHHGGLLVEGRGQRLFFAGDSFTPTGIDDYCMGNRNPLGAGRGFDYCLRLVRELKPDLIFNAHVPVGFAFTEEQYDLMLANLAARERSLAAILPWDHPNYGLDPHWVRCSPYEQTARPGERVTIHLLVTNHSEKACDISASPVLPSTWGGASSNSQAGEVSAASDASLSFDIDIPEGVPEGRYILPFSVEYADRELALATEAVIEVRR